MCVLQGISTIPKNLRYTLRFPSELRSTPFGFNQPLFFNWQTHLLFPMYTFGGPRNPNENEGGTPSYVREGFTPIQDAIMRAFVRLKGGAVVPEIQMQRFPYPAYTEDILLTGMHSVVPLIVLLSFIYPCINTVRFIAVEKEKQLKEAMKIMGLPSWLHWTGWFIKTMIFLMISISFIVVLLKVGVRFWTATNNE